MGHCVEESDCGCVVIKDKETIMAMLKTETRHSERRIRPMLSIPHPQKTWKSVVALFSILFEGTNLIFENLLAEAHVCSG